MIGRALILLVGTVTWTGGALAQHGATVDRGLEGWVVRTVGAFIVLVVLVYTIKLLVHPGEKGHEHIKRRILDDKWPGGDNER